MSYLNRALALIAKLAVGVAASFGPECVDVAGHGRPARAVANASDCACIPVTRALYVDRVGRLFAYHRRISERVDPHRLQRCGYDDRGQGVSVKSVVSYRLHGS